MSIDSVSKSASSLLPGMSANLRPARADFQALSTALNSNDLAGAQQDFAALEKDAPALASAISSSPSVSGTTGLDSMKALASSLQANDLAGAKSAMSALNENMAGGVQHRHHHHHRAYTDNASATAPTTAVTPPPAGSSLNATA